MRFHCNSCGKDFTTLSLDKGEKAAFSKFLLDDMHCPHCGATNTPRNLKPMRKSRSRWQPKRRSLDTSDYPTPSIAMHSDCQKRVVGSIASGRLRVACEGCPSAFNCLTGNVDDGSHKEEILQPLGKSVVEQANDEIIRVEEAVKAAELLERKKAEQEFVNLKRKLGKLGFCYEFRNGEWCARFCGTIWKLNQEDTSAILTGNYNTQKTTTIKNTFNKRGIDLSMAENLLRKSMMKVLETA